MTAVAGAAEETDRLVHLAEDLLLLAQSDDAPDFIRPEETDLTPLLEVIVTNQRPRFATVGVTIELSRPATLPALVDPSRIRQAIDNVLDNAIRFAPAGSVVSVDLREDGGAVIDIADEGPGIDAGFVPRAFDRFASPDGARGREGCGAGLGRSIVQSIVLAHGGSEAIERRSTRGTLVRITIPSP